MPSAPPSNQLSRGKALVGFLAMAVAAGVLVAVGVTPALALTGMAASTGTGLTTELPAEFKLTNLDQKTGIYAKRGGRNVRIASFYTEDREIIGWGDVPAAVKEAALAAEDVRFYSHGAVDPTGIARALVADTFGGSVQGASTITQQVVKNLCVQDAERRTTASAVEAAYEDCTGTSVGRKVREMRYAIALEKHYTKNQILLGYLNLAGFGGRVYGIQSAAKYYFDRSASKLSAAQAASLLAIVNDPAALRLDAKAHLAANTVRRNYILSTERAHGMLTAKQYASAVKSVTRPKITPAASGCAEAGAAAYFCDAVVNSIENSNVFGRTVADRERALQNSGWKIYTTLDLDLEDSAHQVMAAQVPASSPLLHLGATAVSVQVGTGRVLAMVQNTAYSTSARAGSTAVNYNTDNDSGGSSGIQPGSTYKLFTLLQWLKSGHTLSDSVDASERTIPASSFTRCGQPDSGDAWSVHNDEGESGQFTVADATAQSVNGAFASMAQQLDLCDIRKTAEAFDVHPATGGDLMDNPSSVIGAGSTIAPLTMAAAYAGVANRGVTCTPVLIDRIATPAGSAHPVPEASCSRSVDQGVADAAVDALHGVITGGTASGDQTADGLYEFGKTGTTDGNTNTWMIGSTSKVTTAAWVGNVSGFVDLRSIYSFPYCAVKGSTQAAIERHCLWNGIQTAANAIYGGATEWPAPDPKYLYGAPADAVPAPTDTTTPAGTVPDVTGMTKDQAEAALVNAGFAWSIGTAVSSSQPAGTIVSTAPAAGTAASQHTEVTIVPSGG